MKKLKRIQKILIALVLVFVSVLSLVGIGLKACAAENFYSVQGDESAIIVFNLYDTDYDYRLIYDDSNNQINLISLGNGEYYLNGLTSQPMYANHLYGVIYQNDGVYSKYRFYEIYINISDLNSQNDLVCYFLYEIQIPSGQVNNFYIYSYALQLMTHYDFTNIALNDYDDIILTFWYNRYIQTIYYNNQLNYGNKRYNAGYSAGYDDGQAGETAISPIWNVLTGIFSAVGSIFAIELAPHIYLGYFILVPLFFTMILGILAIWRKNW